MPKKITGSASRTVIYLSNIMIEFGHLLLDPPGYYDYKIYYPTKMGNTYPIVLATLCSNNFSYDNDPNNNKGKTIFIRSCEPNYRTYFTVQFTSAISNTMTQWETPESKTAVNWVSFGTKS